MISNNITTIAFDADDTLWQNEVYFKAAEARLVKALATFASEHRVIETLYQIESQNIGIYGFGIKGFTLSMLETAFEVSSGQVPAATSQSIVLTGKEMLSHPVELLPGVEETLQFLSRSYRLLLITKGDLKDQQRKIDASGVGDIFYATEIVADKTPEIYTDIFARHGDGAEKSVMVGNSLKSDILPALASGAWAIHIPHELSWAMEHAHRPSDHPGFAQLQTINQLCSDVYSTFTKSTR